MSYHDLMSVAMLPARTYYRVIFLDLKLWSALNLTIHFHCSSLQFCFVRSLFSFRQAASPSLQAPLQAVGLLLDMCWFGSFSQNADYQQSSHASVYEGREHESKWTHELVAGAAGFEAMRLYEQHKAANGQAPSTRLPKRFWQRLLRLR
jgi:hypothetical protein